MRRASDNLRRPPHPGRLSAASRALPSRMRLGDGRVIRFPAVMGVLNVTPDSFSDGGQWIEPRRAIDHALAMADAGADIIDIGGESTRPGAPEVEPVREIERVMPVLEGLSKRIRTPISIDTRKSAVADAALAAGVSIVNDVSGFTFDPAMLQIAARARAAVVIMHMRGVPATMMRKARYGDVVAEVVRWLRERARAALAAGVPKTRIILDPGIGFAKNARHNLLILNGLPRLCALGYPVLVGTSRKSFIRRISGASEREIAYGTAAADALAVAAGASIVRVHDPAAARAAVRMAAALRECRGR